MLKLLTTYKKKEMLKIEPQTRLGLQFVANENENEDREKESCLRIFGFENLQIYPSLVSHVYNT